MRRSSKARRRFRQFLVKVDDKLAPMPAQGRFWIEPNTGLGCLVPIEMRED